MKTCTYCGRKNDDALTACWECGTELGLVEPTSPTVPLSGSDRIIVGLFSRFSARFNKTELLKNLALLALASAAVLYIFGGIMNFLFSVPYPPQPAFGFKGDWRSTDVFGFEERPLPPAAQVWQDYSAWQPGNQNKRRLYLARLGGAERQSAFVVSTNSGDTPMGAQRYTHVDFTYTDPMIGTYRLSWMMRGEHDPSFLKFDSQYRLYQLELVGPTNEYPPSLYIHGIEGIRPEHYVER